MDTTDDIVITYVQQNNIENYMLYKEEWFQLHGVGDHEFSNNHNVGDVEVKLAYNLEHLYVMLRSQQHGVINRDRAYQNGDGFHFVLSKTNQFPAKEFFVVAVNPLNHEKQVFVWYRNMDLEHYYLEGSTVETTQIGLYQYYAVKLKWSELEWCNPALTQNFGFNISYVKAMENGHSYTYILKEDQCIQWEESSRKFIKVGLSEIENEGPLSLSCALKAKNLPCGEYPVLSIMASKHEKVPIVMKIKIDDKYIPTENIEVCNLPQSYEVDFGIDATHGKHSLIVEFYSKDKIIHLYEDEFSIVDNKIIENIHRQIKQIQCVDKLSKASKDTLEYEVQSIEHMIKRLHSYESGDNIIDYIEQFNGKMELMRKQGHVFVKGQGRYAFVSGYDGTLQPYTLYLPQNINEETRMLIYLHGSGTDDRDAFSKKVWAALSESAISFWQHLMEGVYLTVIAQWKQGEI